MIDIDKNKKHGSSLIGHVFNIQHFCVDDGPGIRTTVFLKGCPLKCIWCHNPESHKMSKEIMLHSDRCVSCGKCALVCENNAHCFAPDGVHLYNRSLCKICEECIEKCSFNALEAVGKPFTVDEVMSEILTDKAFYKSSNGGVTISGGEPTAQIDFTEALLYACKHEGLNTCIETCAWCSKEAISRLILYTDLFLVDWKISDDALHQHYTGVSNTPILENLELLHTSGASVVLRCPMIPDINVDCSHFDFIADLANRYDNIKQIDLEPYHPLGLSKSSALGRTAEYTNESFLQATDLEWVREYISDLARIPVKIS